MGLGRGQTGLAVGKILLGVDFESFFAKMVLPVGQTLIGHPVKASKIRLAIVATSATALAWERLLAAKARLGVTIFLELPADVRSVQKFEEPIYFIAGLFAEAPYSLEDLLGGNVGLDVKLTSGVRWPFYGGLHSASLELPACHGRVPADSAGAGRVTTPPETMRNGLSLAGIV
ncbi:hypothetical protein V5279_37995 [Bradyrhizobium sp. 26S5]|uniref:hypothetical protein n=1 Tax=Bradyrhizobium sp. 26S5 TaxID=3139729 RepID=UPI0030D22741